MDNTLLLYVFFAFAFALRQCAVRESLQYMNSTKELVPLIVSSLRQRAVYTSASF